MIKHEVGWCDAHGKKWWPTRQHAKRIANQHSSHKSTYRCTVHPDYWHVGELHPDIVAGNATRDEMYRRTA